MKKNRVGENVGVNNNIRILFGVTEAFLGCLVGVILWSLLYNSGYIESIKGLVMVVCAMKEYEKFGGEIK